MSELSELLFSELEKHLLPSGGSALKALKAYVEMLERRISELEERVRVLEGRAAQDSGNSNKPPSSDGLKKARVVSNREVSARKPGGQPGRSGTTLAMSENPDVTIDVVHDCCSRCGESVLNARVSGTERRQVVDIPPIEAVVTEYRSSVKECRCCGRESRAKFPENVPRGVSYGERIRAVAVYLMNQHLIPYERTAEICDEVLGTSLSVGALYELNETCHDLLEDDSAAIKEEIKTSPVVNLDETGVRCNGKLQWCHAASTATATHYEVHAQRGKGAFDAIGILPQFSGTAVHDHLKAYFEYLCKHALCNAHHLRELKFVHDEEKEPWAGEMRELLKTANGSDTPAVQQRVEILRRYDEILARGYAFHAALPEFGTRKPGARGRKKQRPSKNLLDRLSAYKTETLRFLEDPEVPFTNNQAEQDLRMQKVKQKISGCHRTTRGAQIFCRIRGFISTVRKRRRNVLNDISQILQGNSVFASG